MFLNVISALVMGGMFLYMWNRARFATARKAALVPLAVCVLEMLSMGMLSPAAFPALTALLVFLRLSILAGCAGVMQEDKVKAARRQTKKVRRAQKAAVAAYQLRLEQSAPAVDTPARCA